MSLSMAFPGALASWQVGNKVLGTHTGAHMQARLTTPHIQSTNKNKTFSVSSEKCVVTYKGSSTSQLQIALEKLHGPERLDWCWQREQISHPEKCGFQSQWEIKIVTGWQKLRKFQSVGLPCHKCLRGLCQVKQKDVRCYGAIWGNWRRQFFGQCVY